MIISWRVARPTPGRLISPRSRSPASAASTGSSASAICRPKISATRSAGRRAFRRAEDDAAVLDQRERRLRAGQRIEPHAVDDVRALGGVALEEFAPGRHGIEQLRDDDARAHRPAAVAHVHELAAVDEDLRARLLCPRRASAARSATRSRSRAAPRPENRTSRAGRGRPSRRSCSSRAARATAARRRAIMPAAVVLHPDVARGPPLRNSTSIRVAPASRLFSTSSLTTAAGRSMTSPAAIWLATRSDRMRIVDMRRRSAGGQPAPCASAPAAGATCAGPGMPVPERACHRAPQVEHPRSSRPRTPHAPTAPARASARRGRTEFASARRTTAPTA